MVRSLEPTQVVLFDIDDQQFVITAFDGTIRRIGRRGEGPGELSRIDAFSVDRSSRTIWAVDGGKRQLVSIDMTTGSVADAGAVSVGLVNDVFVSGDSVFFIGQTFGGSSGPELWVHDATTGSSTRQLYTWSVVPSLRALGTMSRPVMFHASAMIPGAGFAFGQGHADRYEVFFIDHTGDTTAIVARQGASRRMMTDAEIAERRAALERRASTTGIRLPESVTRAIGQEPLPWFFPAGLYADASGMLIATTLHPRPDSTTIDVFTPAGAFAGSVTVRDRVLSLDRIENVVAVLVERMTGPDSGLTGVDVYRMR